MAFADNFETFKSYATNAAQSAAKTTKKLTSIAKANIAILAEEDKVKKAQLELGKVYYKDFILDEEPDLAEYMPWCDKITESLKRIDNLKMEIELARQGDAPAAPEDEIPVVDAEPVAEEAPADEKETQSPEIVDAEEESETLAESAEEVCVEEVPAEDAPAEE